MWLDVGLCKGQGSLDRMPSSGSICTRKESLVTFIKQMF